MVGGPENQFNIHVIFSSLANALTVASMWSPVTKRPRFPTIPNLGEPTTGGLDVIGRISADDVTEGDAMGFGVIEEGASASASGVTDGTTVAFKVAVLVVLGETTAKVFGVEAGTTTARAEDDSSVEGPSVKITGVDALETASGVADWPAVTVTVTTLLAVTVTVATPQELASGVAVNTCFMTGDLTDTSDSSGDSVFERAEEEAPGIRRVRVAILVRRMVVRVSSPAFSVRMGACVAFLVSYGVTMPEGSAAGAVPYGAFLGMAKTAGSSDASRAKLNWCILTEVVCLCMCIQGFINNGKWGNCI